MKLRLGLICRLLTGALAYSEPVDFGAVAAGLHTAPATAAVAAFVEEEPAAIVGGTFTHTVKLA